MTSPIHDLFEVSSIEAVTRWNENFKCCDMVTRRVVTESFNLLLPPK
jgi:hypothetical protein